MVEVKSKQHLDSSLMELNKLVLSKLNESLSLEVCYFEVRREVVCAKCG